MRILVVDDHEFVRKGICAVLASENTYTICGEAVDGQDAIEKALSLRPDIVVMDISMPRLNGLQATREIKRLVPETEVVIVSQHESAEMVRQAMKAGARGFVVKSAVSSRLLSTIEQIRRKEEFVEPVPVETTGEPDTQEVLQRSVALEQALRRSGEENQVAERQLRKLVETLEARVSERTQELAQAERKLRDLSASLLQTQDEERRRIARELHDGIGQDMAAMKMNLARIGRERANLSAGAGRALDENCQLVEEASQQIRTMSHLLHPPLLDEVGIESALRWYVDGFAERSKIRVRMELTPGFGDELPRDLALSLFRIVQESLTNIHRHSGSPTALIRIERSPTEIVLRVEDEGHGISAEQREKIYSGEGGVGFRGMQERVRQFGGRLEIESSERGTRVTAVVPFPLSEPIGPLENSDPGEKPGGEKTTTEALTVLCIDDDATGLSTRKMLLESAGYRVIEARSGAEGIKLFQSHRVGAVILDYWMNEMKGTAVAFELKRIDPTVPIIVLSGVSDLPGEAVGVIDRWLVKGSHRGEKLLESLSSVMEHRASPT
jgi:signal transduction histidine kinase